MWLLNWSLKNNSLIDVAKYQQFHELGTSSVTELDALLNVMQVLSSC